MNPANPTTPVEATRSGEWRYLIPVGILSLVPYLAYHSMFGRLFWFADDIDMVDQIDRMGFWHWLFAAYAENFVPLSKLFWGGAFMASGGSYAAMIAFVWVAHALNTVLLGRVMRAGDLPWTAVFAAQVVFGLTPVTIETLAWSVQLPSMLSVTFMLVALDSLFRNPRPLAPVAWAAASAMSFARGVLTGPMLALGSLMPARVAPPLRLSQRVLFAAAYAAPSVVIALLMATLAPGGNQGHMTGHWGSAAMFGAWYYLLNPAYHLLSVESFGPRTLVALGLLKVALVGWSLVRSRGRTRILFLILLAFDLGTAALLGFGRYHTGLLAAISSRYQYASLIAVLPSAGFALSRLWERLPAPGVLRRVGLAAVLAVVTCAFYRQWAVDLEPFTASRGTESRRILLIDPDPGPYSVPAFPGFPTQRAKALIASYNLH